MRFRALQKSRKHRGKTMSGISVDVVEPLAGAYTESDVLGFAAEDGRASAFTEAWGSGNSEPRVLNALNIGVGTSASLISHECHDELALIEADLERLDIEFLEVQDAVQESAQQLGEAREHRSALREDCLSGGLMLPNHHWRQGALEVLGLTALGVGDICLTSSSLEVFGLSGSRLGFLPINELQLVAASIVVALMLLTRMAGHHLRELVRHIESFGQVDREPGAEHFTRRSRVRAYFSVAHSLGSVLAVFGLLLGISAIRTFYFEAEGISAHQSQFLMIQSGIALAGLALSYRIAHPFDQEWRSANLEVKRTQREFEHYFQTLIDVVGGFNGGLRVRHATLMQHRDWAMATKSDAERKGQIYARGVLLAQPEPTTDRLFEDELPRPMTSLIVDEIDARDNSENRVLKRYEPIDLTQIREQLQRMVEQRSFRSQERGTSVALIKKLREPSVAAMMNPNTNGKRPS